MGNTALNGPKYTKWKSKEKLLKHQHRDFMVVWIF